MTAPRSDPTDPSPWDSRRARIEPVFDAPAAEPAAAGVAEAVPGAPTLSSATAAPPAAAASAASSDASSSPASPPTPSPPPRRPTLRFACAHPLHAIALGFGSGLPRFAPGSWGTLAGWLVFVALDPLLTDLAWLGVIVAGLALGALAAQRTAAALGTPDSSHIVIDEMVAFWIVLVMLPDAGAHPGWLQAAAFGLFRLFDIAKPAPIGWIDARIHNGLGVMLDDVVAALYTLLVIAIGWRLL